MTQSEKKAKLELYYKAKEAYYNGQEIMSDYEFDMLEKELGLDNKSQVGAQHNPSYTIKHPFIMGSLSKVQVHKSKDGEVNWGIYYQKAKKYFQGNRSECPYLIITPKFDGCSFECEVVNNNIKQISSRGDGEYGKDLTNHLKGFIPYTLVHRNNTEYTITSKETHFVYRGEVLIKKQTFLDKYQDQFVNPRSFVSGILNRDYSEDTDFQEMLHDLSIVIYDYHIINDETGEIIDKDWMDLSEELSYEFKGDVKKVLPDHWMMKIQINNEIDFQDIYEEFAEYRHNCPFALDGIVIKPLKDSRINNLTEPRPEDCIAIKYIPILEETEVNNITWNLGKTGELIPIIWVNPVIMDGKQVQKCSGHNYGYLLEKKVSIGSKIIMSLAGDIIPFLYKVTNTDNFDENNINRPEDTYEDDIHLMKVMTERDRAKLSFVNSAVSLAIPNIGKESAKKLFTYLCDNDKTTLDFFDLGEPKLYYNILQVKPEEIYFGIGGKNGQKAKKSFEDIIRNISLVDIIKSCNFRFCGPKVAEQCATYLITGDADFEHLAEKGYLWCTDNQSEELDFVYQLIHNLGKTFKDFEQQHEIKVQEKSNQIPIIMTGEPNGYNSKGHFLQCHPEYRQTGSWKEVQIVFTNSFESNTGKMKKAREKGIKIELY